MALKLSSLALLLCVTLGNSVSKVATLPATSDDSEGQVASAAGGATKLESRQHDAESLKKFLSEIADVSVGTAEEDRSGRAIASSSSSQYSSKQRSCRSTVTTLRANEATVLKSHSGYGSEPYPENYLCRWLFIPDDCNLTLKCDLGTRRNLRRSRSRFEQCVDADYLRVLGNRGTKDDFFCGNHGPELKFDNNSAVALVFKTNEREDDEQLKRLGFGLGGFNCKIVCQGHEAYASDKIDEGEEEKPVPAIKPAGVDEDLNCNCGESRAGRIICPSGHNCTADLGSIPWQAGIVFKGKTSPWCGGSLINDRYVLTAAHCLIAKTAGRIQVILGDHDWTSKAETVEARFNVEEIIRHPRFGKIAQFDYDFALLRLDRPVNYRRYHRIRPVCLPSALGTKTDLVGRTGMASGWGVVDPKNPKAQPRVLQKVPVTVISMTECRAKYRLNPVTDNMMCAQSPGADACFGDSGGPFTIPDLNTSGRITLEGVISWGKSCADRKYPGVYAEVKKVLPWIEENTKDSRYCSRDDRRSRGLKMSDDPVVRNFEYDFGRGDRRAL